MSWSHKTSKHLVSLQAEWREKKKAVSVILSPCSNYTFTKARKALLSLRLSEVLI